MKLKQYNKLIINKLIEYFKLYFCTGSVKIRRVKYRYKFSSTQLPSKVANLSLKLGMVRLVITKYSPYF